MTERKMAFLFFIIHTLTQAHTHLQAKANPNSKQTFKFATSFNTPQTFCAAKRKIQVMNQSKSFQISEHENNAREKEHN